MHLSISYTQKFKNYVHGAQAFLTFIAWCLAIAIFTKSGSTDGRIGWFFGVCWISIPVIIYQSMVPIWPRTKRFAHPYVFALFDVLLAIFWFSAFIAVSTWIATGKSKGSDDDDKKNKSGCANWAYGSESKCKVAEASVGFGVGIFLLWIVTSALSIYGVSYYRRNGSLPGASSSDPSALEAQTQYAFSSAPDDHDLDPSPEPGLSSQEDDYTLLHNADAEDYHPTGYGGYSAAGEPAAVPPARLEEDTSYAGAYGRHSPMNSGSNNNNNDASFEEFHDDLGAHTNAPSAHGHVDFPAGNYERLRGGVE